MSRLKLKGLLKNIFGESKEKQYRTARAGLTDVDKADALEADNPPDLQALIKTYQDEWNDMVNAENAGDFKTALAQVPKVQNAINQLVTTAEENKQKYRTAKPGLPHPHNPTPLSPPPPPA